MADRVIFFCAILLATVYFYATAQIPSLEIGDPLGPKAFPRLLGVCLLIAAGLLLLEIWKDRRAAPAAAPAPAPFGARHWWVLAGVVAWSALFYSALEKAGFIVATSAYLLGLMGWFNRGRWIANVLTSVLFSALSYVLFLKLEVRLPSGILPF